jgi:hypothetical protein
MAPDPSAAVAVAAIVRRIADLQLVNCHMSHERVRCDNGQPVRCGNGSADAFSRVPLCSPDIRAGRLACGHTVVRYEVQRDIDTLTRLAALEPPLAGVLSAELGVIGHDIQQLDHRKGDAEKQVAVSVTRALENGGALAAQVDEARAHVQALEQEHDAYVGQLRAWRERVLHAVAKPGHVPRL